MKATTKTDFKFENSLQTETQKMANTMTKIVLVMKTTDRILECYKQFCPISSQLILQNMSEPVPILSRKCGTE